MHKAGFLTTRLNGLMIIKKKLLTLIRIYIFNYNSIYLIMDSFLLKNFNRSFTFLFKKVLLNEKKKNRLKNEHKSVCIEARTEFHLFQLH